MRTWASSGKVTRTGNSKAGPEGEQHHEDQAEVVARREHGLELGPAHAQQEAEP